MEKAKINWAVCFSVAFVLFTTQFGGGFASGRQIIDYFVGFGWYAIFTPILAQAVLVLLCYVGMKISYDKKLKNYNEFSHELYGRFSKFMSPLFELLFNLLLCVATAVAFATGGSTMTALTGIPYIVSTLIIAVVLLWLTIFGYKLVQKAAFVLSVMIVVGMFIVFVPNIIYFSSNFIDNYVALSKVSVPAGEAMWRTLLYVGFQVCCLGAYVVHAKSFSSVAEVKASMWVAFFVNTIMIMLSCIGLISVYNIEGMLTKPVPVLIMVQSGVGATFLTPVISILIFLGSLSTGVMLVYGMVNRLVDFVGRLDSEEVQQQKAKSRSIVFSLAYIILTFCIAQFGLIPLVAKGYSYCGYGAIFIIIIPIIVYVFNMAKPQGKSI